MPSNTTQFSSVTVTNDHTGYAERTTLIYDDHINNLLDSRNFIKFTTKGKSKNGKN